MKDYKENIFRRFLNEARAMLKPITDLPRALELVRSAAPRWTVVWVVLLIIQGLLPVASVQLTRLIIDALALGVPDSVTLSHLTPTITLVVLLIVVLLIGEVLQGVVDWVGAAQSEYVNDRITALVHQQSLRVDLSFYEMPTFYDHLDRARSDAGSRSLALLESVGALLQHGITLAAMVIVLIPYGSWLPLVLLLSTLPAFYVMLRFDRGYHKWWEQKTAQRRRAQYFDVLLTHSSSAPELRLFNLGGYFQSAYQDVRSDLRSARLKMLQQQNMGRLTAGMLALGITGITMVWMVWRTLQGLITLGDLVLFYQAFSQGQRLLRLMLSSAGQLYSNSLFLRSLYAFLDLEPQIADPPTPVPAPAVLKQGICFQNVTFKYPGAQHSTLLNLNMNIPAGKIVAIVGENGAGKSTLAKVLCRFYDPQEGRISLDEVDLRDIALPELRHMITVLFQSPVPYHTTARENIGFGDISTPGTQERIESAARSAGAHEAIMRLPQAYESLLGKWFADGNELSGGEWQRIALARAFFREAPIIILDEPTSFMDPWAEADWFDRLQVLTRGRTSLIITHRFTIARRADLIYVMKGGSVVESGTHAELVRLNGLYAESWAVQVRAASDSTPVTMYESD